ncbi:Piso0_002426 [Millerozyma farinosa CBS 7064]|uniref:Piso0_002426 protein n=1 Tax=Pichia sorbitophila (strain ATCC MYA-4447 / BCRC 22081 / CBS 7064 / NBRC 10061 / NRRL Y-12695) TaxID=559304 RepID=G8YCK7_PICSO|nr:Piso0_002426 [Millerozyma farinosa CBS 7064]
MNNTSDITGPGLVNLVKTHKTTIESTHRYEMFGRNCRTIYMDPFLGEYGDTFSRPGYVRPDPELLLEQLDESRVREANLRSVVSELRERECYYQDVVKQFQLRDAKLQSQIRGLQESLSETRKEAQKAIKEAEKARREARSAAEGKEKDSCCSEPTSCTQCPEKSTSQKPAPQEIRLPVESFLSDLIREFTGVNIKPNNLHTYNRESEKERLDEQVRRQEEERKKEERKKEERKKEERLIKQREEEERQRKQKEQEERQRKQKEEQQRKEHKKQEEAKLRNNPESAATNPLDDNVQKFMALLVSSLQAQQPYNPLFQNPTFSIYQPETSSNVKSNAGSDSKSQRARTSVHSAVSTPEDSEAENESISSMPASPVQRPQEGSTKPSSDSLSSSNLHKHPSMEEVEDEEFVTLRKKTSSQSQ